MCRNLVIYNLQENVYLIIMKYEYKVNSFKENPFVFTYNKRTFRNEITNVQRRIEHEYVCLPSNGGRTRMFDLQPKVKTHV